MMDDPYLAGILDGEGYIAIGGRTIMVSVTNTDARLVQWLRTRYKGGVRTQHQQRGNRKRTWQWTVYGQQAEDVIRAAYSHLLIKREQADVALAFRALQRPWRAKNSFGSRNLTAEELSARDDLDVQMRRLNHRGVA